MTNLSFAPIVPSAFPNAAAPADYRLGFPIATDIGAFTPATAAPSGYTAPINPEVQSPMAPQQSNIWDSFFRMSPNADGSSTRNGLDFGAIGGAAKGIASLGAMFASFQQNKLAKESLQFSKDQFQTNLTNQLASYNMSLEDRANSRASQNNSAPGTAENYINKHQLGG